MHLPPGARSYARASDLIQRRRHPAPRPSARSSDKHHQRRIGHLVDMPCGGGWTPRVHVASYSGRMPRSPFAKRHRVPVKRTHWLESSRSALGILKSMREGGALERALAALSLAGVAHQWWQGEIDHPKALRALGLETRSLSLDQLLFDLLQAGGAPFETLSISSSHRVLHWESLGAAAVIVDDELEGFLIRRGAEREIAAAIAPEVWGRTPHIRVLGESRRPYLEVEVELELAPLPPRGDLVGVDGLDTIVANLSGLGAGRTILVRGPSGVGKSTFAQFLAERLVGSASRFLQIPAAVMAGMGHRALGELASFLRPDVLLIDDVPFEDNALKLLTRLELVRSPDLLVVLTQMTEPGDIDPMPAPGALYHPGMRPGRIDEVITLLAPDREQRRVILQHYLGAPPPEAAIDGTEGLTGAYLKELARRIRERGPFTLEKEIASLLAQAPIAHAGRARARPSTPRLRMDS
jgi:hypothetical protein